MNASPPAAPGDAAPATGAHRRIRSYVLRQGRHSTAAARALAVLAPRYSLAWRAEAPDWRHVFGRDAPLVLEIGFGSGATTAEIARTHPHVDFVAVDVYERGVANLARLLDAADLGNVRIVRHDAVDVVADMIAPATLGGVHVYFPDPWPKKRHHKRRLLQAAFVHALALRLRPGGYLHVATDWQPYADEILATCSAEPLLANTATGFAPRPAWRPRTKFEARGLALGHAVCDILFKRADG
ncbi:MAG: tRNA (guanosine(46)-N7)-methyltransferase TrmB [Burkholderiales bacterium]|jgi:tRNA (guanine-N7-)-methyltransferase